MTSAASSEIDAALARAVVCRALAAILGPPSGDAREPLSEPRTRRALPAAAALLDGGAPGPVSEAARRLVAALDGAFPDLDRLRARLFGPTLRGRVCPYETEYGGAHLFQQAQSLADVAGYYLAFGLTPPADGGERADHAALEFEFLGFLSLKEAYALERRDAEMVQVSRAALRRFLRDHLGRFGRAFGVSLEREDPEGIFGSAGSLAAAFLAAECRRQGVAAGPDLLALRPEEPDGAPMACGPDPALVQIGYAGARPSAS
jgi:TorA maturation chaperone TorD